MKKNLSATILISIITVLFVLGCKMLGGKSEPPVTNEQLKEDLKNMANKIGDKRKGYIPKENIGKQCFGVSRVKIENETATMDVSYIALSKNSNKFVSGTVTPIYKKNGEKWEIQDVTIYGGDYIYDGDTGVELFNLVRTNSLANLCPHYDSEGAKK